MDLRDICKRLGLPKHADRVYSALTKSNVPLLVADIAKSVSVSRVVVYRCLSALERMGVIERSELGKRTVYAAKSPRAFSAALRASEQATAAVIREEERAWEKEVPRTARFLRGAAGIRAVFDEVILHTPKGGVFYRYTSERDLERVNRYLSRDYRERRDRKKLERLVISNVVSGKQKRQRLERFIKYIPPDLDQFEQNIIQLVYGTRIAFIDLATEQCLIIENQQLADFQRVIFKALYKRL